MPYRPIKGLIPVVEPLRIKYKDIFDMKAFYETLHEWLLDRQWSDLEDGKDHWETYYGERIDQSGAKEVWIRWRLRKMPPHVGGTSNKPFLTYYLDMNFHCLALTTAEVIREGVKWKVNKGEVELTMIPFVHKSYEEAFSRHWLLRHLQSLFSERIYRKDLEARKKELYHETYELANFIKQWFKLKRYLPYEEVKDFFASYAWPSHVKE